MDRADTRIDLNLPADIPENKLNYVNYFNRSQKKDPDDWSEPVRAILTDFVTDILLLNEISSADQHNNAKYINFLKLIFESFENFIGEYRIKHNIKKEDLFFSYKGGSLMRITYLKSKMALINIDHQMAQSISQMFSNFDPFFKISDADFGLIINPKLQNYDAIFDEIFKYSDTLLKKIRDVLTTYSDNYFSFLKDNIITKLYKYQVLCNKINDTIYKFDSDTRLEQITLFGETYNCVKNVITHNKKNNSERDDIYLRPGFNNECFLYSVEDSSNTIYSSVNQCLEFSRGSEGKNISSFNLIRCKVNFKCTLKKGENEYFTRNLGGELIDISIPTSRDIVLTHFYDHDMNKTHLVQYHGKGGELDGLNFTGFSLSYLIKDVSNVIFLQPPFPWFDPKYTKRLNRYCVLMALLFSQLADQELRELCIRVINTIKNTLREPIKNPSQTLNELKKNHVEIGELKKNTYICENKETQCEYIGILQDLVGYFINIYNLIVAKSPVKFNEETVDYDYVLREFETNMLTVYSQFSIFSEYCTIINTIALIYGNSFTKSAQLFKKNSLNFNLIGGSYEYYKYMSYKKKYHSKLKK